MKLNILTLSCLILLQGCASPPECRLSEAARTYGPANAGCLVVQDGHLLVVQERRGSVWNIPGGGASPGKPAGCSAHRETWEETGQDVQVERLLHVYENGFHLFYCRAELPDRTTLQSMNAPYWLEIKRIDKVPLEKLDSLNWRFPSRTETLKNLANSL